MPLLAPELRALAADQGGPFTTGQAGRCGYDGHELRRLLRRGLVCRLRRGVYVERPWWEAADGRTRTLIELRGLMLRTGPCVVSHHSAAAVHGLPLLEPPSSWLDVTRADRGAARHEAGVRHHAAELVHTDVVLVDDLPVTSLARTTVDVARLLDFRSGVVLGDAALRSGLSVQELRDAHARSLTWPGARTAGRVVAFADGRAESPGESLTRVVAAEGGLPEPELQAVIRDRRGVIGRCDLLFVEERTIGEFDGRVKYSRDTAWADPEHVLWQEKQREDRLRAAGFEVVRVVWADLDRPAELCARFRAAFARAALRRPSA